MEEKEITKKITEGKHIVRFDLKKPTKAKALMVLQALEEAIVNKHYLDVGAQLQQLARFFAPNIPAKTIAKDGLRWSLQSASTDPTRPTITMGKVFGEYVVSTDGRRLHKSKHGKDVTDGAFLRDGTHISGDEYEKIGTFPNYEQVVPAYGVGDKFTPKVSVLLKRNQDDKNLLIIRTNELGKTVVDEKLWNQAIAGMENPEFSQGDACMNSIMITDKATDRLVVLMPVRTS